MPLKRKTHTQFLLNQKKDDKKDKTCFSIHMPLFLCAIVKAKWHAGPIWHFSSSLKSAAFKWLKTYCVWALGLTQTTGILCQVQLELCTGGSKKLEMRLLQSGVTWNQFEGVKGRVRSRINWEVVPVPYGAWEVCPKSQPTNEVVHELFLKLTNSKLIFSLWQRHSQKRIFPAVPENSAVRARAVIPREQYSITETWIITPPLRLNYHHDSTVTVTNH